MRSRSAIALATIAVLWATSGPRLANASSDPIVPPGPPARPDLGIGQFVKVEGRTMPDGTFAADEVTLRDADGTAKIEGTIDTISSDRRRLQMMGFPVVIDAGTRLYRGTQASTSRAMLSKGAWIEAKGAWRNGTLTATRIRFKEAPEATQEIEGTVEAANAQSSTLTVMSHHITLSERVAIVDERTGQRTDVSIDRLRRDDDDSQGVQPIVIGPVVLGGRLEAGVLDERRFDLSNPDIARTVLSRVQLLASSELTDTIEAYAKVTTSRNLAVGESPQSDVRVSEAYVLMHRVGGTPIDLQLGRQRFRDSREWLFDEYLDGARVHLALPGWKLEGAVTRGLYSGPDSRRARRDQWQVIGSATTQAPGGVRVGTYIIGRNDQTRGERSAWLASIIDGRVGAEWSYWSNVALRRGATTTGTRLRSWAADVGIKHRWATASSPTATLGYAVASGDRTRSDGIDTRFRQTDLEDNQAYFGGFRRLALYGELFDPELSNLTVVSVGFGVRPRRGLALDLVYHRYAQAEASTSLPSNTITGQLTGVARRLGQEVDVVVTLRALPGLDLDLAGGAFLPGSAFSGRTRPAFFWRPQLRFYF